MGIREVVKAPFIRAKSLAPGLYRKCGEVHNYQVQHIHCLMVHGLNHLLGIRTLDMCAYSKGAREARILRVLLV